MNNNDSNDLDNKNTAHDEMSEQLVWERLQNEAVAAQRWRLEQEMEQACSKFTDHGESGRLQQDLQFLPSRFTAVALGSFVILSLAIAIAYVW